MLPFLNKTIEKLIGISGTMSNMHGTLRYGGGISFICSAFALLPSLQGWCIVISVVFHHYIPPTYSRPGGGGETH